MSTAPSDSNLVNHWLRRQLLRVSGLRRHLASPSLGYAVIGLRRHLASPSLGYAVICFASFGYAVIWLRRHLATLTFATLTFALRSSFFYEGIVCLLLTASYELRAI